MRYPVIDLYATGERLKSLRKDRGMSVRDIQHALLLAEPQAIYKWERGKCLPNTPNLVLLSRLFDVPIDTLLVVDTGASQEGGGD